MTTEPKAEGVEASLCRVVLSGWVFVRDEDEIRVQGPNGIPGGTTLNLSAMAATEAWDKFATRDSRLLYALADAILSERSPTPTPSAVEALARAAKEARSGYAWHAGLHLGGTDRLDSEALARIDTALAHPEIAALLKETKA